MLIEIAESSTTSKPWNCDVRCSELLRIPVSHKWIFQRAGDTYNNLVFAVEEIGGISVGVQCQITSLKGDRMGRPYIYPVK